MPTCNWNGYNFEIYPPNTQWNDVGGVYVFAGQAPNGRWNAYYIGKCDSFRNRLPNHERWNEAVRLGATHIHAMTVSQEATRQAIEEALIQWAQPTLNTQKK